MQREGGRWDQTDRTRTPPVAWGRGGSDFQAPGEGGGLEVEAGGAQGPLRGVQAETDDCGGRSGQG